MTGPMVSGDTSGTGGKGSVLLVSHSYGYGGDLMYYGEIFAALRALEPGLAVAVDRSVAFENPHGLDLRPFYRRRSVEMPSRSGYARAVHAASPTLAARVAAAAPEVLVAIEFTPISLLALFGSLASRGTKRVLLVESDPSERGGSASSAVLALKRRAVRLADRIRTNNEGGERYLVDTLGADSAKIDVGPYLTSRPPGPAAEPALREGPLRLLFANSLTPRKNPQTLVQALALLPAELRDRVQLTFVGEGPERGALEALIHEKRLAGRVTFVGHSPYRELGRYYAEADVLVNPTQLDYRSLSSFEGLGYGLALLVSDRDGAANETVIEGETGYTFSPDDPQELANRIAGLASDPEGTLALRRNALALYDARFSVERAAANIAATIARARGA